MKRTALITILLLLVTAQCFAWTKVVQLDAGHFSVNEDSIIHYTAKGGFAATEGVYNWYNYKTRTEISSLVRIRDDDLFTVEVSSCMWVDGIKHSCSAVQKVDPVIRGSNGETIYQWMVNYGRQTRASDGSI